MKRLFASIAVTLSLVSCQAPITPLTPAGSLTPSAATPATAPPLQGQLSATANPSGTYQVKLQVRLDPGFRTQAINCNGDGEQGSISPIVKFRVRLFGPGIPTDIYPLEAASDGIVTLLSSDRCDLASASTLSFNNVPEGAVRVVAVDALDESDNVIPNTRIEAAFPLVHGQNLSSLEVSYRTGGVVKIIDALRNSGTFPEMRRVHLISKLDLSKLQALVDALTGFVPLPRAYAFHPGMLNLPALTSWLETLAQDPNITDLNAEIEALTLNTAEHSNYLLTGGTLTGKVMGATPGEDLRIRYNDLTSFEVLIPGTSITSSEVTFTVGMTQPGSHLLEGIQSFANPPRIASSTVAHNASGVSLNFTPLLSPDWAQADGPPGGRISALSRADSDRVYAGSETGGVYVSDDSGSSWSLAINGLGHLSVTALAAVPNTDVAYVATLDGVYKTTDGGLLWSKVLDVTPPVSRVNHLFVDPHNNNHVYAGTQDGIRQTLDAGLNWTAVNGPSNLLVGKQIHTIVKSSPILAADRRFFAADRGPGNKVYRSEDGANWEEYYDPVSLGEIRGLAVEDVGGHVLVALQNGTTPLIKYSANLTGIAPLTGVAEYGGGALSSLAPAGAEISQLYVTLGTTYVGTRNHSFFTNTSLAGSWLDPNYPGENDHRAITAFDKIGVQLLVGTQGSGVAEVTSGFMSKNIGINGQYITAFAQHPSNSSILAAATKGGGVFLSMDSGNTWTVTNQGLVSDVRERDVRSLAFDANGHLYAGTEGAGVRVLANPAICSTEAGWQWRAFDGSFPSNASVQALLAADGQIFAGLANEAPFTASGLYKTPQATLNCNDPPVSPAPWSTDFLGGANVYSLAVKSPGSVGTWQLVAGLNAGQIRKSTDSGATWASPVSTGLTGPILGLFSGASDIAGRLYAIGYTNQGVARSSDGGTTWATAGTGLPNSRVKSIAGFRLNANHLLVGLESGGVYQTIDGGASWSALNNSEPPFAKLAFPALWIDQSSTPAFIVGGTSGMSAWRIDLTQQSF